MGILPLGNGRKSLNVLFSVAIMAKCAAKVAGRHDFSQAGFAK
jgi:hypothetical protein